jgi:hypothetical protein
VLSWSSESPAGPHVAAWRRALHLWRDGLRSTGARIRNFLFGGKLLLIVAGQE